MTRRAGTACLVAAALLAITMPAAAAPFDARAAWTRFLAGPIAYDDINDAYQMLGDVGYAVDRVDAAACTKNAAALDAAVAKVPVGLALRHASMLCAEARHDAAAADVQLEAVAALTRLALSDAGTGNWPRPIRIVRPEDALALVQAAGYRTSYSYFTGTRPDPSTRWTHAVVDPESGHERHLTFDWVDTLALSRRDTPSAGYPVDRVVIADAFLDNWGSGEDVAWVDARAVRDALHTDDVTKALATVRGAAARGGLMSAATWLETCREHRQDAHCADGLVDALLPPSEKGQGLARSLLAIAYLEGVGVAPDPEAARALVASADATWTDPGASVFVANQLLARSAPLPDWLVARLDASRSPAAAGVAALARLARQPASPDPGDVAVLERPENNLAGRGLYVLANLKDPRAPQWLERAAAAGAPEAQRQLAFARLGSSDDAAGVDSLLRAAALGGDKPAALMLGYRALEQGRFVEAENWWLGPAAAADVTGLRMLASLYARDVPGVRGDSKRALELYDLLSQVDAQSRRDLAQLLLSHARIPHDPARARKLLEQDADAGEVESQMLLAAALAAGDFGKPDRAAAIGWFERSVATGRPEAKSDYGMWLYRTEPSADGRRRGVAMVTQAADAGVQQAINNVAWIRCVSPDAELRDAKAGLAAAARMGRVDALPAGLVDTVAACHALDGDFDGAARLQMKAIAAVEHNPDAAPTLIRMRQRLALYRAHRPYVEEAGK